MKNKKVFLGLAVVAIAVVGVLFSTNSSMFQGKLTTISSAKCPDRPKLVFESGVNDFQDFYDAVEAELNRNGGKVDCPYQVHLYDDNDNGANYICGGNDMHADAVENVIRCESPFADGNIMSTLILKDGIAYSSLGYGDNGRSWTNLNHYFNTFDYAVMKVAPHWYTEYNND